MKPKHEIPWRRHKEVAEKNRRTELIARMERKHDQEIVRQQERLAQMQGVMQNDYVSASSQGNYGSWGEAVGRIW